MKPVQKVILAGLPGAGKSRFKQALQQALCPFESIEWNGGQLNFTNAQSASDAIEIDSVWCLIDVRNPPEHPQATPLLKQLLARSDRVILAFMESADLARQTAWMTWLKEYEASVQCCLPRFRWYADRDIPWQSFQESSNLPAFAPKSFCLKPWQTLRFEFDYLAGDKPLMLDHLLMGLDAAQHNLAQALWRVKAEVMTQEYENPVQIEGSVQGLRTYAGTQSDFGFIEISGEALDASLFLQIVDACRL